MSKPYKHTHNYTLPYTPSYAVIIILTHNNIFSHTNTLTHTVIFSQIESTHYHPLEHSLSYFKTY